MKVDDLGSLLSCLVVAAGMFCLPPIQFNTIGGIFSASWAGLGILVASSFLKNFFQKR